MYPEIKDFEALNNFIRRTKMTDIIITKKIVHDIFNAKLKKKSPEEIAKDYPFSAWTVREILKRNKGKEFVITKEMEQAIMPQRSKAPFKKTKSTERRQIIDSVVNLTEAKRDFLRSIKDAYEAGLTKADVKRIIQPLFGEENGV